MQSVLIITEVASSTPVHGKVYSIQHYVIRFANDSRQIDGFFRVLRYPPTVKLTSRYNWNIVESGVKHHSPIYKHHFLETHIIPSTRKQLPSILVELYKIVISCYKNKCNWLYSSVLPSSRTNLFCTL